MEKENKQVLGIIENAIPQLEIKKQVDIAYSQGVADGWRQAFEYIKQQMQEQEKAKEENK